MLFVYRFIFVMVTILSTSSLLATECSSYPMSNYVEPSFCDECCDNYSEIYVGAIGYGVNRRVDHSVVGLDDFFGWDNGHHQNSGTLWGAVVGYTYRNPCNFYFNAEFDYGTGHHKGESCQGSFPKGHINQFFTTFKLGYNFQCDCLTITPYGGIGNWYECHQLSHGNKFHYSIWFGILGGRLDWQYNDCLTVGVDAEGFIPFHSNLHFNTFSKDVKVNGKWGGQVELPIRYNVSSCYCDNLFITLAPFYRFTEYGKSKFFTCGIESFRAPKLRASDYGAKLYIGRTF